MQKLWAAGEVRGEVLVEPREALVAAGGAARGDEAREAEASLPARS